MSVSGSIIRQDVQEFYRMYRIYLAAPEKSCKSCLRLSFDDHERDVIGGARPLCKFRQRRLNPIAYPRRRRLDVARYDFIQTRRAKLFTSRTHRLRDAVRIDHEHVSRLQLRSSFAILSIALDAERQTTRSKLFDSSRRMNNQWRIVTGVQKRQRTRFRIELSIKQRYKPVRGNVVSQVSIDRRDRGDERIVRR